MYGDTWPIFHRLLSTRMYLLKTIIFLPSIINSLMHLRRSLKLHLNCYCLSVKLSWPFLSKQMHRVKYYPTGWLTSNALISYIGSKITKIFSFSHTLFLFWYKLLPTYNDLCSPNRLISYLLGSLLNTTIHYDSHILIRNSLIKTREVMR